MYKQNALLTALTAVITALVLVASTQPMWLTFVVMVPMVVVAMKVAITITKINEKEEEKDMTTRMNELDNLINENTEAFHAVARYECRGSAWEAILNAERYALFAEKWAIEDANA